MTGNTGAERTLRFTMLGPLQVRSGEDLLELGPYKQRLLLAALLCRANTVLSVDQLIDALWDGDQPRTARKNLQVYVSALRKVLRDRIGHVPYGYTLTVTSEESDLLRFDELAAAGRQAQRAGHPAGASALFGEAVRLWQDRPLVDLLGSPFAARESERLADRFLAVYEDWAELEVEAGRALGLLDRLAELTARHPFRERLIVLHMTALDQVGGRRQALACFEQHRQYIARELGLDPSPVLQQTYRAILAGGGSARPGRDRPHEHARPSQLPRDLADFVGRRDEVEAAVAALTGGARCTDVTAVSGPPGVGTTALAVHVGHRIADRFADGQVFVPLGHPDGTPRDWHEVLTELLRSTGLDLTPPREETAALALWRSWIADRQVLLVLDGATGESQVRRLLPGRGPTRTLVTSARRLSGLECVHRIELDEFTPGEARELLARVLDERRLVDADRTLRRLQEVYGLSPLVVRALAAKLTTLRHLSLSEYAEQLGRLPAGPHELSVGGCSVQDGYRRFHQGLDPQQRAALGALGALPGPAFDQAVLLAALGGLAEPAERIVEELIEAHLVTVAEDDEVRAHAVRYRMPRLAHRYAAALHRGPGPLPGGC
ncbi:AfsR/SARP family transcriptional regulator [Kitasatospora sp. NBC_01246]|uniref:AfsR/SARP family transcriptional regulator n=1 Tax=Kitasatospora sp. NBC_01246 TaxID=2903570 RepID=UPI002E2FD053|nr:BTAD domain-containing putative transcriptional regulator [Kitasatospora sp. NBC_01246]